MKATNILIIIFSFLFASCATTSGNLAPINIPNIPNPSNENKEDEAAKPLTNIDLVMKDFNLPKEANTEIKEGDPLTLVMSNNVKFSVTPKLENYKSGAAVYYPFVPNYLYKIYTSPNNVTVLQLEPGERIISQPVSGDVHSFALGTQYCSVNSLKTTQIHLQPTIAGKQTTLIVNTDKRTYYFLLYSYRDTFMPIVTFSYPFDFQKEEERASYKNDITINGDIANLDFAYAIVPKSLFKPQWAPTRVFTDGVRTYLHFPSAKLASYAPVLFLIEDNKQVAVNYHVRGNYYVVDQVIETAELVLDKNKGNIITIKRDK